MSETPPRYTTAADLYRALLLAAQVAPATGRRELMAVLKDQGGAVYRRAYEIAKQRAFIAGAPWDMLDCTARNAAEAAVAEYINAFDPGLNTAPQHITFELATGRLKLLYTRPRLQEAAGIVAKNWKLYGGGEKPAELQPKPKSSKKWSPTTVRVVAELLEDGQHLEALEVAEKVGGVVYPTKDGGGWLTWAPESDGLEDGFVSVRCANGYQVLHLKTGATGKWARTPYKTRKNAVEAFQDALTGMGTCSPAECAQRLQEMLSGVATLPAADTEAARAEWLKKHAPAAVVPEDAPAPAPAAEEAQELPEDAPEWMRVLFAGAAPAPVAEEAAPVAPAAAVVALREAGQVLHQTMTACGHDPYFDPDQNRRGKIMDAMAGDMTVAAYMVQQLGWWRDRVNSRSACAALGVALNNLSAAMAAAPVVAPAAAVVADVSQASNAPTAAAAAPVAQESTPAAQELAPVPSAADEVSQDLAPTEAPTAAPVVADVVADAAPASQELAPVPSAADKVPQDLAPVVAGFVADIPAGLAVQAYTGTSFSPERRGASIRKEYADDLAQVLDVLQEHARKGGTLDKLADVFQAYRTRQGRALRAYLASSSHCFSAMIAGPARFPVARMQKREGIAHKRLNEYLDGGKVALQRAIRELRPDLRPIMASDADAIDRLTAKLAQAERDHAMMKAGNVAIRKHAKAGQAHQVAALLELGFTECAAIEATKPDHMGRAGFARFELTNSNANIKRIKERIEQIERNQAAQVVQTEGADGVTLEDDAPANRVRLYFPGKPSDDVRADLKAHGFRWAPSVGAWQAYRNWRALTAAQRLAGVNLAEVAPASQEPAPVPSAADEVPQVLAPTEAPTAAPVVADVVADAAPASQEPAPVPSAADEVPQVLAPTEAPTDSPTEAPTAAPVVPTVPTLHQKARAKSGAWEAQLWQAGGLCWLAFLVLGAAVPVLSSYATRRDVLAALQRLAGVVLSPAELGFAPGLAGLERVARLYADAGCGADAFVSGVLYAYKDCHEYGKAPTTLGRWTKLRADMEAQGMPAGIGLPGFFDAVQCVQYPAPVAPTEAPTEAPTVAPLAALDLVEHTTARGKVLRGVVRADLTKEEAQALDAYTFRKDGGWFIRERHLTEAAPVVAQAVQVAPAAQEVAPVPTVADKVAQVLADAQAAATDGTNDTDGTDSQGDERAALLAQFAHLEQGQGTATASRNIKRQLKRAWPGVVFGVRKDSASAVRVTWADGPSEAQVKALVGRFCEGSFDGMTDCYNYRADVFNDLFGGCCYLFTRRDVGDDLAQRAIEVAFEGWATLPTVEDWRASHGLFDWSNDGQVWARRVRNALEKLDGVADLA